eukprot:CAMPEP_0119369070 /NCGR_PEP_ID=MMETSP1334-20130426/15644_1 /TAXON_ID=127549 /ORGANISM="Calcidiscus leptoporus, Strain RCC1130" /LENGTH=194 /DNA_ID=CAMNT_0007385845 /DNA_START=67 /DNA_END=651 /DNA_ORIENTATION=-
MTDAKAKLVDYAGKAKDATKHVSASLQELGYFEALPAFNRELVLPLKQAQTLSLKKASKELLQTLKGRPEDPEVGFSLWNVLGFYLSVIGAPIAFATGGGGLVSTISSASSIVVGYLVAYTLYWGVIVKKGKQYNLGMLVILAAYGAYCAFSTFYSIFNVPALVVFAVKTLTVMMMLINGVKLFSDRGSGVSLI